MKSARSFISFGQGWGIMTRSGVVRKHPPGVVFQDKPIASRQRTIAESLIADHQRAILEQDDFWAVKTQF